MKGVRSLRQRIKKDLKDPEFKKAFDDEEIYAAIAIQIAKNRERRKLTQVQLARKMHTTQHTVSRLEDISNKSYSIDTLIKASRALGKKLQVKLV